MKKRKPPIAMDPAMRDRCEKETVRLLPFIERLAHRTRLPLPIEDLVQEGAQAAFEAIPRFDPQRGAKLESWLSRRIIGAMLDYARRVGRLLSGGARTGRVEQITWIDRVRFKNEDGKDVTGAMLLPDREPQGGHARSDDWARLLRGFSDRERLLVLDYFVAGRTMKQIGAGLGLSESRVSQQMAGILARLKTLDADDGRVREFFEA